MRSTSVTSQISNGMIMAAGLGTRLRPFTDLAPKPLLPLLGVPMLQFAIDALTEAGVSEVAVNFHAHAALARERYSQLDRPEAVRLHLSDESLGLLGSGGGVRTAAELLGDGAFFLLNADTLCDVDLAQVAASHQRLRVAHGVEVTLVVFEQAPAGGKYRELLLEREGAARSGLVKGLGDLQESRPFFVGVAVVEKSALLGLPAQQPFEFVDQILRPALARRKVGFHLAQGIWLDVGSPALWFGAHLELLRLAELGRLPPRWQKRIERRAQRVSEGVWLNRALALQLSASELSALIGPAFIDVEPSQWRERKWGPGVVAYGELPPQRAQSVIAYQGVEIAFSGSPGAT